MLYLIVGGHSVSSYIWFIPIANIAVVPMFNLIILYIIDAFCRLFSNCCNHALSE